MISEALLAATVAYFGGTLDDGWTNAPTASRFYPATAAASVMVKPDGERWVFNHEDGEIMRGPSPWVARRQGARVDVWNDPQLCVGKIRTGFTFIGGQLRGISADGREFKFPSGIPARGESGIAGLFPEERVRELSRGSSGDIWHHDAARWRLWFANPNDAGVLIVLTMIVLSCMAIGVRRRHPKLAWLCAGACLPLLVVALKTASRGALVAMLCGFAVIAMRALFAERRTRRRSLRIIAFALLALAAAIVVSGNGSRLMRSLSSIDAGNRLRMKVARAAMEMFADAPQGWCGGEVPARSAALNWYIADERHIIRTHLITLAELGWFKGGAYLALWFFALALGWHAWRRRQPAALAVWAGLFVAGCFNPVYRRWETWLWPAATIVWTVGCLSRQGELSRAVRRALVVAIPFAAVSVVALAGGGRLLERRAPVAVYGSQGITLVNGRQPDIWIVEDRAVLGGGGFPGREIMMYYHRHPEAPAVGYVYCLDDLPAAVGTLVLPGRRAQEFLQLSADGHTPCQAKRIVFLSPACGPAAIPAELQAKTQTVWFAGTLAARYCRDYSQPRAWVRFFPGCELYIPDWVELVFANRFHDSSTNQKERIKQ